MPRRDAHLAAGALIAGISAYVVARNAGSRDPFAEAIGGAFGGLLTAGLPDDFEPAHCPSHRASAHSVACGGLVSTAFPALLGFAKECREYATTGGLGTDGAKASNPDEVSRLLNHLAAGFAVGLGVGYLSHLALDAGTPAGLPWA